MKSSQADVFSSSLLIERKAIHRFRCGALTPLSLVPHFAFVFILETFFTPADVLKWQAGAQIAPCYLLNAAIKRQPLWPFDLHNLPSGIWKVANPFILFKILARR